MTVNPGWEIPMNRQYLEYIPEIGTPAENSHHGPQQTPHKPARLNDALHAEQAPPVIHSGIQRALDAAWRIRRLMAASH